MSVRDEFEAWLSVSAADATCVGDVVASMRPLQAAEAAWQAAYAAGQESMRGRLDEQWNAGFDAGKKAGRRAGLEEAAKVCEKSFDTGEPPSYECAAAIRALKDA